MKGRYFEHVDGLRALAVLSVVAYHLRPALLPGGFAGVDVFFVISGFVVTASLATHQGESRGAFLLRFYARRLARIAPALLATLSVTTLLYVLLIPKSWLSSETEQVALSAFLGFSNWVLGAQANSYFEPRAEFSPYTHTWSLGVEEQFYLIAPALLYAWVRFRDDPERRRIPFAVLALLATASFALFALTAVRLGQQHVFYLLQYRFWELAAGVVWYQLAVQRGPRHGASRLWEMASWIGLLLTISTLLGANPRSFPWPWSVGAILGTLLLIGDANQPNNGLLRSIFSHRVLVWIGKRSYSLYLWHWPVLVFFRWTVGIETVVTQLAAFVVSLGLAALSYRWIECPVRFSPVLKRSREATRALAFVLIILVFMVGAREMFWAQPELGLSKVTRNGGDWYPTAEMLDFRREHRVCLPQIGTRSLGTGVVFVYAPTDCIVERAQRLFVLGDSHATAYRPLFDQLTAETGRTVHIYDIPGCPFIDLMNPMPRSEYCAAGQRAAIKDVLSLARPGDVVFLASLRLPRIVDQWGPVSPHLEGRTLSRSNSELEGVAAATKDAPKWLSPFIDADLKVVFEAPKPIFRAPVFRCVDRYTRANPICDPGLSEDRAALEKYREPATKAIGSLVAASSAVYVWDPFPVLCPGPQCDALVNGRPLFFDADHISALGNKVLFPSFRRFLDQLGQVQ